MMYQDDCREDRSGFAAICLMSLWKILQGDANASTITNPGNVVHLPFFVDDVQLAIPEHLWTSQKLHLSRYNSLRTPVKYYAN